MQKIAVIGSGAVGCYYGGMLAAAGREVHFLMRSDLAVVRENGLKIETGGRLVHIQPAFAHGCAEEIGACDLVIIAIKTTANDALEKLLPPLLGPGTTLITLQNGLGNEEFLAARWGADRVLGALCYICLNRVAPGVIAHYGEGSTSIGEFGRAPGPRARALAEAWASAGVGTSVVENLINERWRKLVWNIPFNGLSVAAGGVAVDEILADAGLRIVARELMGEVLQAAHGLGEEIPESYADFQIARSWEIGAYKPSSLIDWELRRPLEVEAIWGEPWRRGVAAGATMDRLEMLYRLLHRIDLKNKRL